MAVYEIPEGYTVTLVATMPRSGTWYSFYFLEFLDLYLSGRTTLNTRLDLEVYHGLKLGKIHVHTICPGFLEICDGDVRRQWDALTFYGPGFNYGYGRFISGNEGVFSPARNEKIKIVYIFRNPLDQAVSYFRHIQHHRQASTRSYVDADGSEIAIEDARHYLRSVGIEAYIKQYFTFQFMKERYPDHLLMIPYETLVRSPDDTFVGLLSFLGFSLDTDEKKASFRKARNSTSVESLKNIETAMGGALARDQLDREESHLRGGKIGKWKEQLNQEDVKFVDTRLREFGLALEQFQIE